MDCSEGSSKNILSQEGQLDASSPSIHHNEESGTSKPFLQASSIANVQQKTGDVAPSPSEKISELLKDKEGEWTAVVAKKGTTKGPIRLLDLPLDVLKEILKEVSGMHHSRAWKLCQRVVQVTHTNDLTSLALTCSALHAVVVPMIYSRFDIVWPDASSSSEPRSGVDALTYGLATLVMREDLFQRSTLAPHDHATSLPCGQFSCRMCGMINHVSRPDQNLPLDRKKRRGNYFSEFTKKFSLGNGPADWVQEYLVTKESGKMLGTLICLAIARMPNLESFVWDMPTGILRDIWMALASLGDYEPSKLSKVWVRLHDNKAAMQESGLPYPEYPRPTIPNLHRTNVPLSELPGFNRLEWSKHLTEKPNFSRLPPLQSLTVLAIDEISYIDEISRLIGRSRGRLRELRIGFAPKIHTSGYAANHAVVQCFCLGAELSLLLNCIDDSCDPRSKKYMHRNKSRSTSDHNTATETTDDSVIAQSSISGTMLVTPVMVSSVVQHAIDSSDNNPHLASVESHQTTTNAFSPESASSSTIIDPALTQPSPGAALSETPSGRTSNDSHGRREGSRPSGRSSRTPSTERHTSPGVNEEAGSTPQTSNDLEHVQRDTRLKVETLELEGTFVTIHPLRTTINFLHLTSLTLLNCNVQERFWSDLGRLHPPLVTCQRSSVLSTPITKSDDLSSKSRLRRMPSLPATSREPQFPLKLKRLHTDAVSAGLMAFLKDYLAPNSLEWLFLQDSSTHPSLLAVDTICKGPIRRHRTSLTKVLIDSSVGPQGSRPRTSSAQKWMLGREALTFISSGKMSKLRELAIVVDYKDWHFLLQRLPNVPHLRSLYVPQIMNHVYSSNMNIKELAMGVLDVVSLRPEIELCYLGVSTKCFEILEKQRKPKQQNGLAPGPIPTSNEDGDGSDGEDPPTDEDDEESDSAALPTATNPAAETTVAADHQAGEDDWSTSEDERPKAPKGNVDFKLREILFYDDKISIFKARHGRL